MLPEEIKQRLQKLMTFEEGAMKIGSQAEAENAAARIQEILLKYNLERSDIENGQKLNYVQREYWVKNYQSKTDGKFIQRLFSTIARYNLSTILISNMRGTGIEYKKILLFGTSDNLDIIEYLIDQLVPKIKQMKAKAWGDYHGHEKKNTFTRGYYQGVVWGIDDKLKSELDKYKQEPTTNALILHRTAEAQEYMHSLFPNTRTEKRSRLSGWGGTEMGLRDGKNMSINKGISSNSLGQKLIK